MNREERKELTAFRRMVNRLTEKGAIIDVTWLPGDVVQGADELEPEDGAFAD